MTREELVLAFVEQVLIPSLAERLAPLVNVNLTLTPSVVRPAVAPDTRTFRDVELSLRTYNCLHKHAHYYPDAKLTLLSDLKAASDADLLRVKNFGRKSLNELREVLATS